MKTCCQPGSFSMLWSSYMLMGSVFGSQTFSHLSGFVVDVRYLWTSKSWSHLNSSSWCVRLMGNGIGGGLETQENLDVVEAGEDPWINEGLMKGGQDSPLEVVIGIGPEIGVLMMMSTLPCPTYFRWTPLDSRSIWWTPGGLQVQFILVVAQPNYCP